MTEIITIDGEGFQIGEDALISLETGERISLYDDDGDAMDPEDMVLERGVGI